MSDSCVSAHYALGEKGAELTTAPRIPGSPTSTRKTRNPGGILMESCQDYQDYQEFTRIPGIKMSLRT